MNLKSGLIRGTFILTAAGFLSRLMGFFFRIFMSHTFGEENVGLYQLIFPVYAFCISLGCAGIETARSRTTARKTALGRPDEAKLCLLCALILTSLFSFAELLFLQKYSVFISESFLGDVRCAEMLLAVSYALPFAAVHCCISGYCFGRKKTELPAITQLAEQAVRILSVMILCLFFQKSGREPSVTAAAAGIAAGEAASALLSCCLLRKTSPSRGRFFPTATYAGEGGLFANSFELLRLSLPLTANRAAVTLLQGIEAASIPACLKLSGMSTKDALSMYGVLTGMALPCILFPSAITSSVGTVLMPAVSQAQAEGKKKDLASLVGKASSACLILGLVCCFFFLLTGNLIGRLLFDSSLAGKFILTLAWICPFLYLNTALLSTINGLGKTFSTFLINVTGLAVRIAGVFAAIPSYGIQGYLWGLLASQCTVTFLSFLTLLRLIAKKEKASGKF